MGRQIIYIQQNKHYPLASVSRYLLTFGAPRFSTTYTAVHC